MFEMENIPFLSPLTCDYITHLEKNPELLTVKGDNSIAISKPLV